MEYIAVLVIKFLIMKGVHQAVTIILLASLPDWKWSPQSYLQLLSQSYPKWLPSYTRDGSISHNGNGYPGLTKNCSHNHNGNCNFNQTGNRTEEDVASCNSQKQGYGGICELS